ncbi:MAG: class I SAM-dependent methyltransferase [Planctomycetes bacterium]|nr:class I SAM-dependent methyltransferase [Planctomycetota bacterium]
MTGSTRVIQDRCSHVFDDEHYASTTWQKIKRSLQLGTKYYLWDLPRYFRHRRTAGLPMYDWATLRNPLREFYPKVGQSYELPDGYDEGLRLLDHAGIRLTMPQLRLEALVGAWWTTRNVPGEVIECGAYRGATSLLLATLCRIHSVEKRVLVLDTFRGVTATSPCDVSRNGCEFVPPPNQPLVLQKQAEVLQVRDRIEIWPGLFADSFQKLAPRNLTSAFVHIDANLYQGTWEACEFTIPRTLSRGVVVFDDYNGVCDLGARLAIDRYLAKLDLRPRPLAGSSAFLRLETPAGFNQDCCKPV